MSDFWDEWGGLIVLVLVVLGFFGLLFFLQYQVDLHSCMAKTEEIGFQSKYDIWAGCRILVEGRWIPLDNWYFKTQ